MAGQQGTTLFILGLLVILNTMYGKTSADNNAYSNNTAQCLFDSWATDSVLASNPTCAGADQSPLCYSAATSVSSSTIADFISCYNTTTLIPDYTAHVLSPTTISGRPNSWRNENGPYKPSPESSMSQYKQKDQKGLYGNYLSTNEAFLSRGHYTPSGDFNTMAARKLTFINTNIAPQWQESNGGNWCKFEESLTIYTNGLKSGTKKLYIFTGTAGQATDSGKDIKLKGSVVTPLYYWKAVCHPSVGSAVFIMQNNVGDITTTPSTGGCNSISQTSKYGILKCLSLTQAATQYPSFQLPQFNTATCTPGTRGTFLDATLATKLQ